MINTLEPATLTVTVLPTVASKPALAHCGFCGCNTYVTLTLSDDHPNCCRRCFRARVSDVRRSATRTR